jgi:hypothetical protein
MALLTGLLVTTSCGSSNKKQEPSGDDRLPVKVIAVPSGKGWGYKVFVDDKLYIDQTNIPAVPGLQTFKSQEEALKIGNLVVSKMKNGKRTVTIQDLKDAHITFDSL